MLNEQCRRHEQYMCWLIIKGVLPTHLKGRRCEQYITGLEINPFKKIMTTIEWTDLICSHMYVTVTCSLYGEEKKADHMI